MRPSKARAPRLRRSTEHPTASYSARRNEQDRDKQRIRRERREIRQEHGASNLHEAIKYGRDDRARDAAGAPDHDNDQAAR
jgi:hypothetical protein